MAINKVIVCDGKYSVTFNEETGELKAQRHGEEWRNCSGDGLILGMMQRIEALEDAVIKATEKYINAAVDTMDFKLKENEIAEFNRFTQISALSGLTAIDNGQGHWQLLGGKREVNFYPFSKKKTIYIKNGISIKNGTMEQAIQIAITSEGEYV